MGKSTVLCALESHRVELLWGWGVVSGGVCYGLGGLHFLLDVCFCHFEISLHSLTFTFQFLWQPLFLSIFSFQANLIHSLPVSCPSQSTPPMFVFKFSFTPISSHFRGAFSVLSTHIHSFVPFASCKL